MFCFRFFIQRIVLNGILQLRQSNADRHVFKPMVLIMAVTAILTDTANLIEKVFYAAVSDNDEKGKISVNGAGEGKFFPKNSLEHIAAATACRCF